MCEQRVAPYLDLQLVAFPQDGLLRSPGALDNLKRALDMGVDVIGGIPHFERTMADGAESVRLLCELAAERGLRVDMHCDEIRRSAVAPHRDAGLPDPAPGPAGRVTGSHLHVDAQHGQLLRLQAAAADRRSRRQRRSPIR